jgi:DNA-binding IclR family transcriptional regulator
MVLVYISHVNQKIRCGTSTESMPKKPTTSSLADERAAPGGAAAVDKAVAVLGAFRSHDRELSVTELAERTRLYKSTVLRVLASLAHGRLVQKTADGLWKLGPEVARLAGIYADSFSLESVLLPEMQKLREQTLESVAFHIRQGDQRLVLYRIDSPHVLRDHVQPGDLLPLDRGAGGRILMAYGSKKNDAIYEQIRREGYVVITGDRVPGLVGVSAPVWQNGDHLVGALTLTTLEQRFQEAFVDALKESAQILTERLGGPRP